MSLFLEQKKEEKRQCLLDAAYALFLEKGMGRTSVSDITERARVAKGTFYLYFHDKENLLQALTYNISYRILAEAYAAVELHRNIDFSENVILLVDHIIEYFKRNREVLRLIERNFSWPLLQSTLSHTNDPLVASLLRAVHESQALAGRSDSEIFNLIFIIVEMCGSTCYSSIIEGRPDNIDNMKPVLYEMIRKSLRDN